MLLPAELGMHVLYTSPQEPRLTLSLTPAESIRPNQEPSRTHPTSMSYKPICNGTTLYISVIIKGKVRIDYTLFKGENNKFHLVFL